MSCNCEFNILTEAVKKGRAHWVCPKCGADVSLLHFLAWEAVQDDPDSREATQDDPNSLKQEKRKKKK